MFDTILEKYQESVSMENAAGSAPRRARHRRWMEVWNHLIFAYGI